MITESVQTVNLTIKDNAGCTAVTSATVNPLPKITGVTVTQNTAITCTNAENVNVVVAGGSGTYTFELLPGGPSQGPVTGTSAAFDLATVGDYTFRVTDNVTGCHFITAPYTVAPFNLMEVTASALSPVTCFGGNDGTLQLNVSGYTGNYNYQVLNSSGNPVLGATGSGIAPGLLTITGLPVGNYSVSLIETNSPFCNKISNAVTIVQPAPLVFNSASVSNPIICHGGTGTVTIVATGGTSPLSYTFNGETNTTGIFSNVSAGSALSYTITDAQNCSPITGSINVAEPSAIGLTSIAVTSPILCNGGDGIVTIKATGGTSPLSYTFNGETNTTGIFSGVKAGVGQVYGIIDANNCGPVTGSFDVHEPSAIILFSAVVSSPILCNGGTGAITINASGGTAPLSYTFNGETNTTGIFTNVRAGVAQIYTITDANNCGPVSGTIDVPEPAVLSLSSAAISSPILCNGGTGTVTILATGGTLPFSYTFNGQTNTTGIFSGVSAGAGQAFTITDANNCGPVTGVIDVAEPVILTLSSAAVTSPILCDGGTATVTIAAAGGTAPLSYTFNGQTNTTGIFTGVVAGLAQAYTITDANNCGPVTGAIDVVEPPAIALTGAQVSSPILCNGGTATVTLSAKGGTAPLSYTLNGQTNTTGIFTGITAGLAQPYSITDANNCVPVTGIIDVAEPPATTLISAVVTSPILCNGGTATVTIVATGGTAPLSYTFNGETNTTGIFHHVYADLAQVYSISDANNCGPVTGTVDVVQPQAPLTISAEVQNIDCFGASNGSISITAAGGTAPYKYQWSDGETTKDRTGLSANSYTLIITDDNKCQVTEIFTIVQPAAPLAATYTKKDVACFGGNNGTIDLSVTGGTSPYSFMWSDGQGIEDRSTLAAGTYTVKITDFSGCTISQTIEILEPSAILSATVSVKNTVCKNSNDGSILVSITGGTKPYSLVWKGYSYTDSTISNLSPGVYELLITDAKGCTFNCFGGSFSHYLSACSYR